MVAARENFQWLKVLTDPSEDLGLIPDTRMIVYNHL